MIALILVAALGGWAWFNRSEIVTQLVLKRAEANKVEVAPYREVRWERGPSEPQPSDTPPPPNIVVILLDDFGFNDLTTFGGGVAGGAVPTPNIDKLAADGAIFSQAYSGTGTCAPSRAMLMTGRYPTRTGFEFTPTPDGMSRAIATIANGNDRYPLPDTILSDAARSNELPYEDQG
ncbi:MAG: sulfatase-like hydrolase/transferase, partial [Pseudomonadota bacterium]